MPLLALAIVVAVIFLARPKDERPRSLWSTSTAFTAEDRFRESERRREEMCRRDGIPFKPRRLPEPVSAREAFKGLLMMVLIFVVVVAAVWNEYD